MPGRRGDQEFVSADCRLCWWIWTRERFEVFEDKNQTQMVKCFQDLKYSKDEIQTLPRMFSGFDIYCKDEFQTQMLKCFQDLEYL